VAGTPYGTRYVAGGALRTQAGYVRTGFTHYSCFTPAWCARYPGAWIATGWAAATAWRAATWPTVYTFCGYPPEAAYYDYGTNVVFQDDYVYIDGDKTVSAEKYTEQSVAIAEVGKEEKPAKDDEWQPLGVFAMVQGDEKNASHLFQLAVNKKGILRGNYYNAVSDSTEPIYGSVNKKRELAAWTVADRKYPVFEVGIANLTKDEATMLVHFASDKTQQFNLVRIEQPEKESAQEK
jgi:hypothetical protein